MLENILPAPPDAILGLTEAFNNDSNPDKINLGVGVYKDAEGKTPVLATVKEAERHLLEHEATKGYLPISGSPGLARHVRALLFGADHALVDDGRAVSLHAPGGTGALRVGGEFAARVFDQVPTLWHSEPTWANHRGVFGAAGLPLKGYAYYDAITHGLARDAFFSDLAGVPAGDVVLLHVCCHNPTGVDLSPEDWQQVATMAERQGFLPFFDFAYQGFGGTPEEDATALQPFVEAGLEFLVASSFSKNFGLYSERVGALTLVGRSPEEAATSFSRLKQIVRGLYSNPPRHGAAIVETILDDPELTARWLAELTDMRERILAMRDALVDGLKQRGVAQSFEFIRTQKGMFSFSGLDDAAVQRLREEFSIYVVGGGRINVAGITPANLDRLCDALATILSE